MNVIESDIPRVSNLTEPILAWRAWTLHEERRGGGPLLRPIGGGRRSWPPREPANATCPRRIHEAPAFHCTCGLHATRGPELLRRARDPAVVGTVALWGRVIEHDRGYRAAFAYPQRLMLICYLCFWQRGIAAAGAEVVTRLRGGRLVPLCLAHIELSNRYGYTTPNLSPAGEVERSLLANYAVDVLRTNLAAAA